MPELRLANVAGLEIHKNLPVQARITVEFVLAQSSLDKAAIKICLTIFFFLRRTGWWVMHVLNHFK